MGELVKYNTDKGEVKLSPQIIRQYLVSGDAKLVTDQEVMMFLQLCQYQKLNPFLREAYLIKFGTARATIVTGKETFLKRAKKNPAYRGHEAGTKDNGKIGWAKVYVDGYQVPIYIEVDYDEYVGKKSDGSVNKVWKTKPKTMLRKVALVQALREAFPDDFGGMYSPEEINTIESDKLVDKPINKKPDVDIPEEIEDAEIDLEEQPEPEEKKPAAKPKKKAPIKKTDPELKKKPAEKKTKGKPISAANIQQIHILAKKLWDSEAEYKEKLFTWTGKKSSKELTDKEGEDVIGLIVAELNVKIKAKQAKKRKK